MRCGQSESLGSVLAAVHLPCPWRELRHSRALVPRRLTQDGPSKPANKFTNALQVVLTRSDGAIQFRAAFQDIEVRVPVQDGRIRMNRDGCNQTVDQSAHGLPFPPAASIQRRRFVIVHGLGRKDRHPREKTAKEVKVALNPFPREHLHFGTPNGDLASEQSFYALADRRPDVTKKLGPS